MAFLFMRGPHLLRLAGYKYEPGGALGDRRRRGGGHRRRMGEGGDPASKLRSDFLDVLQGRRRRIPEATVSIEIGKPVLNPMYQGNTVLGSREVMESCPKEEIDDFKHQLVEENLYLITEY